MTDDGDATRKMIYNFIVKYKREHDGLSPTLDEIAEGCFLSKPGVKYHMPYMQLQGLIRIVGRRGIEIIGGSWSPPEEDEDTTSAETRDDPGASDSGAAGEPDHEDVHPAGD